MNQSHAITKTDYENEFTLTKLGEIMVKSGFFQDTRDASQAIVKIIAGGELGLPPIVAMQNVYIVKGKVSLSAHLMASKVKSSGKYDYKVTELSETKCSVEYYERYGGETVLLGVSIFTMEDAQRAGLANGDNWRHYPKNMLFSRAMSNGCKWYTPDILNGSPIYTPDELGQSVNSEGEVIDYVPPQVAQDTTSLSNPLIQSITITPPAVDNSVKDDPTAVKDEAIITETKTEWLGTDIDYGLAVTLKNKQGFSYGELSIDNLKSMRNSVIKELDKKDESKQVGLLTRLGAIDTIIAHKQLENPSENQ